MTRYKYPESHLSYQCDSMCQPISWKIAFFYNFERDQCRGKRLEVSAQNWIIIIITDFILTSDFPNVGLKNEKFSHKLKLLKFSMNFLLTTNGN